jgi:hypothetical protein
MALEDLKDEKDPIAAKLLLYKEFEPGGSFMR